MRGGQRALHLAPSLSGPNLFEHGAFFLVLFSRYYYLYLGMSFLLTAGTTDDDAFSGVTLVYRTKEREKRFFFSFSSERRGIEEGG